MADDGGGGEVVVHGVVALLAQLAGHLVRLGIALGGGCDALEVGDGVHQALQSLLGSLQGFVGEVHGAAVVRLQDEEADGHGRVGLRELLVGAGEELVEGDEVAQ